MKKLSPPLLMAFLVSELVIFIGLLSLVSDNPYIWAGAGVDLILSGITAYFLAEAVSESYKKMTYNTKNSYLSALEKLNESSDTNSRLIADKFSELTEKNAESLNDFQSSCVEAVNDKYNDLKRDFDEIREMQKSLNDTEKERLDVIIELFENIREENRASFLRINDNVTQMKNAVSEFNDIATARISDMKDTICEAMSDISDAFSKMISSSDKKFSEQLESFNRSISENIRISGNHLEKIYSDAEANITDMITGNSNFLKDFMEDIREAFNKQILDINYSLVDNYAKMSMTYSESNKTFKNEISGLCDKLFESFKDFAGRNTNELIEKCNNIIMQSSKVITSENQRMLSEQSERFNGYIDLMSEKFAEIISNYTSSTQQIIEKKIDDFTDVNLKTFDNNSAQIQNLIATEKTFIEEFEENNNVLKKIISDSFRDYTENVRQTISEFEKRLTDSYSQNTEHTSQHLDEIKSHNKEVIVSLSDTLKKYSDELLDKSAKAVAEVQKENNLELQKLSKSIYDLAEEDKKLSEYNRENNSRTNENIQLLVEQNSKFTDKISEISGNSVKSMGETLSDVLEKTTETLKKHGEYNADLFSNSMDKYRDEFVKSSAEAVASVQSDNNKAIQNANENISKVSTRLLELISTVDKFKDDISDCIEESNDNIEDRVKDIGNTIGDKLNEYNLTFSELKDEISKVNSNVEKNTESYNDTLKSINSRINTMNSLNEKDIELLEKLMR